MKIFRNGASLFEALVIPRPRRVGVWAATFVAFLSVSWIASMFLAGGPSVLNPGILLLPVIIAAFYFGPLPGIATALVLGLAIGPWMPASPGLPQPTSDWAIRLLSYVTVGGIVGLLSLKQFRKAQKTIDNQQAMLEATPEIIEQERLVALREMSSGVVHDINNALAPILGYSEMLLDPRESADPETVKRCGEAINTAAGNASAVVKRLRVFFRQDGPTGRLTPVDLSEVVEQSLSMTEARWKSQARAAGTRIDTRVDCPRGLTVIGDDAELRSVLTNLIFNAVDAMPDGGTLSFVGKRMQEHITLSAIDTGIGMSPDTLRRCIETRYTTKENGTGLGTSIAASIMRYHGGRMEVSSTEGEGSRIDLLFPVPAPEKLEGVREPGTVPALDPLRILVAEDDDLVRQMLEEVLCVQGHAVTSAGDGDLALKRFQDDPGRFDLAISDTAMPNMSGTELVSRMRRIRPEFPLIMLSGFDEAESGSNPSRKPGSPTIILTKPITLNELRKALWFASNQA